MKNQGSGSRVTTKVSCKMQNIGVIVHSASGKDIRRLVARGSTTSNRDKINAVIRMIMAIDAICAARVVIMPDPTGIGRRVIDEISSQLGETVVELLTLPVVTGAESDTTNAVAEMDERGFACVVVFGGDGTCRAAAKGSMRLPMLAVSTGTNNVFPTHIESTLVGMASAFIALGKVDVADCCEERPVLYLARDGVVQDLALVDLVTVESSNNAAQAVWQATQIREMFFTDASPANVGLSSVGGWLDPLEPGGDAALYVEVCAPHEASKALVCVSAPIVPGLIASVPVKRHHRFSAGEPQTLAITPSVACLDGERQITLDRSCAWSVVLASRAIKVIDVKRTLELARAADGSG